MRDRLLRSSTTTTCKQGHRVKAPSRGRADRQASANSGLERRPGQQEARGEAGGREVRRAVAGSQERRRNGRD
jgi:hypothetical protein